MAVSDGTYQRREIVSALAAEKKTATRQKHVQSKAMALACADARVFWEWVMSRPYVAAHTYVLK